MGKSDTGGPGKAHGERSSLEIHSVVEPKHEPLQQIRDLSNSNRPRCWLEYSRSRLKTRKQLVKTKTHSAQAPPPGGGGGRLEYKKGGMLVENFEIDP